MAMTFNLYKKQFGTPNYNGNSQMTLGESLKKQSDVIMETTWWNDPQSKIAYLYDYFHDDSPELTHGMTYSNTTKYKVAIKFIVTEKGSLSKDQPSAKIQFMPSMKVGDFDSSDELYYYQTDFHERYWADFPVGLYIDIPDEKGIYHRWMICLADIQDSKFPKYFVLPCTYQLMWIENKNGNRIKRKMWAVLRSQSSYNSGLWTDHVITSTENQQLIWLPMNSITENLNYISDDNKSNQRFIVDIVSEHPDTWQLSKITRRSPFGTCKLGLYKTEFNPHTDYVNLSTMEMFADYYAYSIEPEESPLPVDEKLVSSTVSYSLNVVGNEIRMGGSYKTVTLIGINNGEEVDSYESLNISWKYSIDDIDLTNSSFVKSINGETKNVIKLKLDKNNNYVGKNLNIVCSVDNVSTNIGLSIVL